ncbi:hypothetical protein N9E34_08055 [Opitutales bacterium]|nr:hypothetical protein [Opitutales bacterium]
MKLNILVLHKLGCPRLQRKCLTELVFFLRKNQPNHNYLYHDVTFPFPAPLMELEFDAIILDVTLLALRWGNPRKFQKIKEKYQFIADSTALKIAFPQDEYDCSALLDRWMCDWGIDYVFSVLSSGLDLIYPSFSNKGTIKLAYTGYVDESLLDYPLKSFDRRNIDIGYRARKLLPYFGEIGETKWKIAHEISSKLKGMNLNCNISCLESDQFNGVDWYEFINDCKFTLGSNSGSSVIDPDGSLRMCVISHLNKFPNSSFQEVKKICYNENSDVHDFTALSPRNIECAILESGQILIEGEYSNLLKPWEHYIPLRNDASNLDEVLNAINENGEVLAMIKRCKEAILDHQELRFSNMAKNIIQLVQDSQKTSKIRQSSKILDFNNINNYNIRLNNTSSFVFRMKNFRDTSKKIPVLGVIIKLLFSSIFIKLTISSLRILGFPFSKY